MAKVKNTRIKNAAKQNTNPTNNITPPHCRIYHGPGESCKICDFGLSKSVEGSGTLRMTTGIGTIEYMAPELFQYVYHHNIPLIATCLCAKGQS